MGAQRKWPFISGTVDPAFQAAVNAALAAKADATTVTAELAEEADIVDVSAGAAALRFLGVEEGWAVDALSANGSGAVIDTANTLSKVGRPSAVLTTVTRSTVAKFTGRNGLMQTAAINALRYSYDPVAYRPMGLRFGPGTTNLFTYSNDFSHANWIKTRATVTANTDPSPDGATTGDSIVCDTSASTTHYIRQNFTAAASSAYTCSYYVSKTATYAPCIVLYAGFQATNVVAMFNPATGASSVIVGTGTARMEHAPNDMWRCSLTATSQAVPTAAGVAFHMVNAYTPSVADYSFTGDGVLANPISCAQFEMSPFPGTYVETTSASIAATAESVTAAVSLVPGFDQARFSGVVEFSMENLRLSQIILTLHDGTTSSNYIRLLMGAVTASTLYAATASGDVYGGATILATGLTAGTTYRVAFTVSGGSMRASVNGADVVAVTFTAPIGLTTVSLGDRHGGGFTLDGCLRRAKIISRLLSDADLVIESAVPTYI